MHTIGIISEYNPFHSGHRRHFTQLRREFGADSRILCLMSGNFVQRGDAAITDKWTRAAMALRGGADLVLELPTMWAASSAETFARGSVSLLLATGVVDTLSFGSEVGLLSPLSALALALDSPEYPPLLHAELDRGLSFPAARQAAVTTLLGHTASCIRTPNNNLAIEYLRALHALGGGITPHTLPRTGAGHDSPAPHTDHVSASYLRHLIHQTLPLSPWMAPEDAAAVTATGPASLTLCPRAVLARLRPLSKGDWTKLPDCGEGLANRMQAAARQAVCLEDLYTLPKSKRYTSARIRRLVLWAFLGLTAQDRPSAPPYLRVLGFNQTGQHILREMKTSAALPVLVKPAHAERLLKEGHRFFALEARCTSLYDLCRQNFGQTPGPNEFTQTPVRWDLRQ